MFRERALGRDAIAEVFDAVSPEWCQGQLFMGHLRYATTGRRGLSFVHPFLRRNGWRARNLCICGNFNMTNMDEIFAGLVRRGLSPRVFSDGYITLELMGHCLDREVERLYAAARERDSGDGEAVRGFIEGHVRMDNVLRSAMGAYDGGYVMCGMTGSGEMFAMRDPWGIRPAFWHADEEVVAVASERAVLQTTFDLTRDDVQELPPGGALVVHRDGSRGVVQVLEARCPARCSFERIYFSRGSDCDIYRERKLLGRQLAAPVLEAVGGDTGRTVFSFIPNTAEVAFYGMTEGLRGRGFEVHCEKVLWKDVKLRTFITEAGSRDDLVSHVYDITYGSLRPYEDCLVIIDDSIVRGTTLRESVFKILDRLHPRKIVMVSSAPQIRYPDYYGIDMARLEEFCAFRAAIALIEERGMWQLTGDVYEDCLRELRKPVAEQTNRVCAIYEPFSIEDINMKMAEMLRPAGMRAPVEFVFQTIEGLHAALPDHRGDWYFTGRYPTPGGNRLVNEAYVKWFENQ